MEGIAWIIAGAYLVIGCFYYVSSIQRIVSFIKTMKRNEHAVNAISLIILLMALIVAWPYLLWLDINDQMERPYEYDIDD